MNNIKIQRALIAVYDKTGIADFARTLVDEFGIEIISTGGTARHLKEAGIPVTMVEEATGFPEMLDGRVKTLHPMIHAAILADRDNPEHMRQLEQHGIKPIDMVVVNLYPFEKTVTDPNCTFEQAIEMIDIGGPCMLRAAAKNFKHVVVIPERSLGSIVLNELRETGDIKPHARALLASQVFALTVGYDRSINTYLTAQFVRAAEKTGPGTSKQRPETGSNELDRDCLPLVLTKRSALRYGENPHLAGAVFGLSENAGDLLEATLVRGTPHTRCELSFNNYVDGDSALSLVKELTRAQLVWHRRLAGDSSECGTGVSPVQVPQAKSVASTFDPVGPERVTRRNLPHIQTPGKSYFVTFRVREGELPPAARDIALKACTYWHGRKMTLHIAIVMPDHVHLLMTPYSHESGHTVALGELLHSIKSYSAHEIAKITGQTGPVWLDENWDRIMRDENEFQEKWDYILTNPERKNLGKSYPWIWWSATRFMESGLVEPASQVESKHRRDAGATPEEHRRDAGATPEEHRRDAGATRASYAVAFIKHTNACGCAIGDDPIDTYRRAYLGDPIAAAGGVLCMNFPVTREIADTVMHSFANWGKAAGAAFFKLDVWIAPSFDDDAIELITTPTEKRKWGKECRLLAVGAMDAPPDPNELDYKKITGGVLVQTRDLLGLNEDQWKVVTKRQPTEKEMSDLRFAWLVCKHTKSNAITLCRDGMLLGNGAGQMSRVKSCDLAIQLARENGHADKLPGAVAAGDAFFPVPDGPQKLIDAGITAIIHPGGSNRDAETIAVADAANVAMILTGTRHFKH